MICFPISKAFLPFTYAAHIPSYVIGDNDFSVCRPFYDLWNHCYLIRSVIHSRAEMPMCSVMRCSLWHVVANSAPYLLPSALRFFFPLRIQFWVAVIIDRAETGYSLAAGLFSYLMSSRTHVSVNSGHRPITPLSINWTESLWSHVSLDSRSPGICHTMSLRTCYIKNNCVNYNKRALLVNVLCCHGKHL